MTAHATADDVLADRAQWCVLEGDCAQFLSALSDAAVDAVVTDPPYGIGEARGKNKSRGNMAVAKDYGTADWDDQPASPEVLAQIQRVSRHQVIFGGNYFPLPPSSCWLVWDKLNGANDFADCELAWTNLRKAVRRIQWRWNGMIREGREERYHPTQKPVGVMRWCIGHLPADAAVILDPFAGSGSTGVAALSLGRRFIGIEKDPKYAAIARERLAAEGRGQSLREFKAGQLSLLADVESP